MRHTKNFATWMFNLLAGLHNKTNRCYIMGRRLTTSLEPQKWPREWLLLTSKGLLRISGGLVQFQMIQPKIWVLDHVLPYKSNLKFFNTRLQNLEVNFKIVDAILGWMEQLFRWKLHIWHNNRCHASKGLQDMHYTMGPSSKIFNVQGTRSGRKKLYPWYCFSSFSSPTLQKTLYNWLIWSIWALAATLSADFYINFVLSYHQWLPNILCSLNIFRKLLEKKTHIILMYTYSSCMTLW